MIDLQTISIMIAATGVTIAAIYYIMILRNTIRTRHAQLLMQIYRDWRSTDQLRLYAKSIQMEWDDYDDFQSKYGIGNFEERLPFTAMSYFFEMVGVLVEEGLVDIKLVAKLISGDLKVHWERFEPMIREHRERRSFPEYFNKIEFLFNQMVKLRGKEWASARIDISKD